MRLPFHPAFFTLPFLLATVARAADLGETWHYAGLMDGKIAISMQLTPAPGGTITGRYFYAIAGKEIFADGLYKDDVITLTENEYAGANTGKFALTHNDDGSLTGTWTSPDGKRKLEIALANIAQTVTLSDPKTDEFSVHTQYLKFPQRNDFLKALNAKLQDAAIETQQAHIEEALQALRDPKPGDANFLWSTGTEPAVTYADASLVSIRTLSYADTGGAHPNYNYYAETYTWREGKFAKLEMPDLVDVRPASMAALSNILVEKLQSQKASWPDKLIMKPASHPTINITRAGLLFTFNPFDVGPYDEGTYAVVLPWKEADAFIPAGSPVRRFMNPPKSSEAAPASPARAAPSTAGDAEFPHPRLNPA